MDEIFVERIVKRKIDIKGMLLRVLAVVLTVCHYAQFYSWECLG